MQFHNDNVANVILLQVKQYNDEENNNTTTDDRVISSAALPKQSSTSSTIRNSNSFSTTSFIEQRRLTYLSRKECETTSVPIYNEIRTSIDAYMMLLDECVLVEGEIKDPIAFWHNCPDVSLIFCH
jgi:hypothetical protein